MQLSEAIAALDGAYEIRDASFSDCAYTGEARQLIFSGVTFTRCRFTGAELSGCEFSGCTFVSCDLSGARLWDAYFQHTTLRAVKAAGTDFTRAVWRDVHLTECAMLLSNFSGGKWDHVTVSATNFRESSLAEMQLRAASVTDCDLTRAELFRTKWNGMDLRSCTLDSIALSDTMTELRGAIIDESQAAALVRRMGIMVK